MKFKGKLFWIVSIFAIGCFSAPAFSYAQNSGSTVVNTIGYFYSASEQMIDAEDSTGAMSSYLTRGERYNGASETFAVSNIKDITADLDSNGNVLNKYTYTAYGTQTSYLSTSNIQNQTLSINTNPFTYDGYYTDSESGSYYLNARYYDPTLGIFLTSDSYNLPNRYMYVNGNPVMGVDPNGHFIEEFVNWAFGHCKGDDGGSRWETNTARAKRLGINPDTQYDQKQNLNYYNDNNLSNSQSIIPENKKISSSQNVSQFKKLTSEEIKNYTYQMKNTNDAINKISEYGDKGGYGETLLSKDTIVATGITNREGKKFDNIQLKNSTYFTLAIKKAQDYSYKTGGNRGGNIIEQYGFVVFWKLKKPVKYNSFRGGEGSAYLKSLELIGYGIWNHNLNKWA